MRGCLISRLSASSHLWRNGRVRDSRVVENESLVHRVGESVATVLSGGVHTEVYNDLVLGTVPMKGYLQHKVDIYSDINYMT